MSSGAVDDPRIGAVQGVKPPGIRELTPRAIICGLIVAAVMGASYPYMVLKLGFGPNVSVVAAFLGYLALGIVFRNYNRWENNMVQTAGTAGAQTAFMCVLLAAFDMLAASPGVSFAVTLTPLQSFAWLTIAGLLGVLLAVPMRQHFVVDEKLTYADGVAAGETLIVLDSRGGEATRAARALGIGVAASAALMLMTEDALVLGWFPSTMLIGTTVMMTTGVGLNWSLLSLGSGMLVGMRINASMLLGTVAGWMVAPYLLLHYGVIQSTFTRTDVLFWVMWPATAMMVSGGLTALALRWSILKRTFSRLSGARADVTTFPLQWVVVGVIVLAVALMVLQRLTFGISMWLTGIAILLSLPLMLVGLRVLGETNWGPISQMTNMMQVIFGAIAPGNLTVNMVSSGTTGTIAVESEALMQDYKGRLHDRVVAEEHDDHAAARDAGRRRCGLVDVPAAAQHVRHRRRERWTVVADFPPSGRICRNPVEGLRCAACGRGPCAVRRHCARRPVHSPRGTQDQMGTLSYGYGNRDARARLCHHCDVPGQHRRCCLAPYQPRLE
jgi:uncharacterized oligopeptide transporter (OPT) family protein